MDFGALLEALNISPPALLVNIIGFLLLYLLLRKVYYGPIGRFLQARRTRSASPSRMRIVPARRLRPNGPPARGVGADR